MVALRSKAEQDHLLHGDFAEQAVLGCVISNRDAYDRVADVLCESDFATEGHRAIWRTVAERLERGRPCDLVILLDELCAADLLDSVGGRPYVIELALGVPSALNVGEYARRVRNRAILRELASVGREIDASAREPGTDAMSAAQNAEERILAVLTREAQQGESATFKHAVFEAVDWLEGERLSLSTGFQSIDRMTGGLQPGALWVIAARPGMGKSALGMQIAEHVAGFHPAAVFSLEMSKRQIAARSLHYHEEMLGSRAAAVKHIAELRLMINDAPRLTPALMRLKLRRMQRLLGGLSLIFIDYAQLISSPRAENRLQEVSEVSRSLKAIAKEFSCTVLAAAQLSRASESRTDRRPLLSDLRESGQFEQDADVVVMIHREDYYSTSSPLQGYAELIVRKCRDGELGTAWCRWNGSLTRFRQCEAPQCERSGSQPKRAAVVDHRVTSAGGHGR